MTVDTISVIQANIYKFNEDVRHDIRKLVKQGAMAVCLNEAQNFIRDVERIGGNNGYALYGTDRGKGGTSILLHDDIPNVRTVQKHICNAVDPYPGRIATCIKFRIDGEKYAIINVHFPAAVQEGIRTPVDHGIVAEFINGEKIVTAWANRLRDKGFRVIVIGDMNWAYVPWNLRPWFWSPQSAFDRRCGMTCNYDEETLPRPIGDKRAIEYVFWHPDDFEYISQRFVGPESSDHPFIEVVLVPVQ